MVSLFSTVLTNLRKDKGLSIHKAAKEIGIVSETLRRYEQDERQPTADVILLLANYYGVSTDYLLGRTSTKSVDPDIQAVTAYTGLTEKAVENLHNARGEWRAKAAVSRMLEENDKLGIFESIAIVLWEDYKTPVSIEEMNCPPDDEESADYYRKINLESKITDTTSSFDPNLIIESKCLEIIGYLKERRKSEQTQLNSIYMKYFNGDFDTHEEKEMSQSISKSIKEVRK